MNEPGYEVVWPLGKSAYQMVTPGPRLSDLKGKTICELSDMGFKAEEVFPIIREILRDRYPGIKFVDYNNFGNTHGSHEAEVIASLPDKLSKQGCDAVISAVGG
ncbi:hypothetical protein ACFL7M_14000 [Thermodesulfobacteriota bacterium]